VEVYLVFTLTNFPQDVPGKFFFKENRSLFGEDMDKSLWFFGGVPPSV